MQNANFFDRLAQEEAAAAAEQAEDIFQSEQVAYQAQPQDAAYQQQTHAAGSPSPATMERLYRAVNKVPGHGQPATQPAPVQSTQPAEQQQDRRFGINSLINRMSGQSAQEKPAEFQRRQPPVGQFDDDVDNYPQDDDRVEIPAFLRRQAN